MAIKQVKQIVGLTGLFLALVSLFTALGCWQWQRAMQKQQLLNQAQGAPQTISLSELRVADKSLAYTPVRVKGYYATQKTFYLTNQFYHHQLGMHVVTPLVVAKGEMLLVDRGWVPLNQVLPHEKPTHQPVSVLGQVKLLKNNPFITTAVDLSIVQGPLRMLQIDNILLQQMWHQTVLPVVLLLDPKAPGGYGREWVITAMPPARHKGYAVQWFALAVTSIIFYLILLWRIRK